MCLSVTIEEKTLHLREREREREREESDLLCVPPADPELQSSTDALNHNIRTNQITAQIKQSYITHWQTQTQQQSKMQCYLSLKREYSMAEYLFTVSDNPPAAHQTPVRKKKPRATPLQEKPPQPREQSYAEVQPGPLLHPAPPHLPAN